MLAARYYAFATRSEKNATLPESDEHGPAFEYTYYFCFWWVDGVRQSEVARQKLKLDLVDTNETDDDVASHEQID